MSYYELLDQLATQKAQEATEDRQEHAVLTESTAFFEALNVLLEEYYQGDWGTEEGGGRPLK